MASRQGLDRKEQIVAAAIHRLFTVGFEGFRVGDVAKDVGINNATLIHHYPSKVALLTAVVERFMRSFEAVADATNTEGAPHEKLARHMRSSLELKRSSPEMFVVLNEIMVRARRDADIAHLVSAPLTAWRRHIVSLLLSPANQGDAEAFGDAEAVATACMAQLLGMGLLLNATGPVISPSESGRDQVEAHAIAALTSLVKEAI